MATLVKELISEQARRTVAKLEGEELDLWIELLNMVDQEQELHSLEKYKSLKEKRAKAHKEKTGKDIDEFDHLRLDILKEKNRMRQRNHRKKVKLQEIERMKQKYGTIPVSEEDL